MPNFSIRYTLTVLALSASLLGSYLNDQRRPEYLATPLNTIPERLGEAAKVRDHAFSPAVLQRLLPTDYLSRSYNWNGLPIDLMVTFYAEQRAGESMHSPKHCLPGGGWEIWKQESDTLSVAGKSVSVNKYYIQNSGNRMVVLYWYQSKDRIISSEYLGKVLLIRDRLVDGSTAGSLVRVTVPDQPGAVETAVKFASAVVPEVQRCFGKAG